MTNHLPIKSFLTYSLGAIILRLIMALSVFATIKFIEPAEFGALALLNNLTIFIPIILGLGLRQVLAIEFFKHQHSWSLVWELSLIYLIFAIPTGTLLIFNLKLLNSVLFANQVNSYLLLLVIATSLLNFFPELLFQLLRFQKKAFELALLQVMLGLLLACLTIYLLYFSNLGATSVLLAQLISQFVASCYFVYLLVQHQQDFRIPGALQIIKYLKIGLPFIPNIILAWLILACNRWLLSWQLDLTQVGIYSVSENISLIFQTIITQPLMHSFLPYAFDNFAQNTNHIAKIDAEYQRFTVYFLICFAGLIPLVFVLCKPILCLFLPAKYLQAMPLILPLLIAQLIFASTYISSASLQYLKKTNILVLFMAASALIAILINLWLIPTYQAYSCLIATNCAYLSYLIAIWLFKKLSFFKSNLR